MGLAHQRLVSPCHSSPQLPAESPSGARISSATIYLPGLLRPTREGVYGGAPSAIREGTGSVVSDSVRPHRLQPTRLPSPWDSPGKNTGAGYHFLLQFVKVKSESEVAQSCPTLRDRMDCSLPGSSVHGIFQARVLEWGAIAFSEGDIYIWASLMAQTVKCLPAMRETWVQ